MKPLNRHSANKHESAAKFKRNIKTTKMINITAGPMRGGIRL
jgi:hypothetical protein